MNYRHAFHAGNFADVLKHATLALVIEHLKAKEKPFLVLDTHAGTGLYRLDGDEARRSPEWQTGIARLLGPDAPPMAEPAAALLTPYLSAVAAANPGRDALTVYPGSPAIALHLMRATDRLVANELHPDDAATLRQAIGRDPRARVLSLDGWQALKANLPPKERRGVVLVDPPFEEPGELDRLVAGLGEGLRRFATGTYLLWFPVKQPQAIEAFAQRLATGRLPKALWVELRVDSIAPDGRLSACGLVVVNPPYRLDGQLQALLPALLERLALGPEAAFDVRWLAGADPAQAAPGASSR